MISPRTFIGLIGILGLSTFAQNANFNRVKATNFEYTAYQQGKSPRNNPAIAPGFLERARDMGYTHVIASFAPFLTTFRGDVAAVALQLNTYGLRLIPYVPTASKWSIDWRSRSTAIDMNIYEAPLGDNPRHPFGCPSLASFAGYDVAMEAAFQTVINDVKMGFEDACARNTSGQCTGLGYSTLEFVYLGHDEPTHNGVLLAGMGDPARMNEDATFSAADRRYITDNLARFGDASRTFQNLLGRELVRRIEQVQAPVNNRTFNTTRVIISGDLWDPEANGGISHRTFLNGGTRTVRIAPSLTPNTGILAFPGLTTAQANLIRSQTVIAPWCYYNAWPLPDANPTGDYETGRVFEYFARSGMVLMYWGNAGDANTPLDPVQDPNPPNTNVIARLNMMNEYASEARKYQGSVLGYIAGIFGCVHYENEVDWTCYKTLEYMKRFNRKALSPK